MLREWSIIIITVTTAPPDGVPKKSSFSRCLNVFSSERP